jgi:hypothetical protein
MWQGNEKNQFSAPKCPVRRQLQRDIASARRLPPIPELVTMIRLDLDLKMATSAPEKH